MPVFSWFQHDTGRVGQGSKHLHTVNTSQFKPLCLCAFSSQFSSAGIPQPGNKASAAECHNISKSKGHEEKTRIRSGSSKRGIPQTETATCCCWLLELNLFSQQIGRHCFDPTAQQPIKRRGAGQRVGSGGHSVTRNNRLCSAKEPPGALPIGAPLPAQMHLHQSKPHT